uniref:Uncharacterized protein n=1 Tax=Trichogramma kaykai TaxID=54128 RepID=A0ABD2W330_9HYME
MDMPEDCWSDHVGLLQEVPNASSADHQQQPQSSSSDYLMLSHSHHHEPRTRRKSIDPSKFLSRPCIQTHTLAVDRVGARVTRCVCATTSFCRHDRSSSGALERRLIRLTLRQYSRYDLKIQVFWLSCYTPGCMRPAGVSQMCRNLRHSQNIPSSQKSNSSPLVHTSSLTSLLTPSNKHPTNSGCTHHLKILIPFHSTSSLCAAAAGRAPPPPPAQFHPSRVYTNTPLSVSLPRA